MAELNDERLIQEMLKGNRFAFELLYERYFDKLVWYANGFVNDIPKAEDIVQEVFVKIIEDTSQFDSSRKFSTWVYSVTANACKNLLRNEQNRQRINKENIQVSEQLVEMSHQSDLQHLEHQIQLALSGMSEKEKNIYNLRFEQELSIKEIASISNIPEGSVKSGIYYILKKFATQLKEFGHGN